MSDDKGRVLYAHNGGLFMITAPIDGAPACHANGGTIGFAAASPAEADAWHAAGVANGGTTCENPPGVRDGGFGKLYLAYLRDPAGNKLCAAHRMGWWPRSAGSSRSRARIASASSRGDRKSTRLNSSH